MSESREVSARAGCVNLKRRFGKRYRVKYEASYYAERSKHAWGEDPWLMIVLCQHGHICPWGGDLLAACTNKRGPTARRLLSLPFILREQSQVGDDGANVVFPVDHFAEVAAIMKPRRRRRLTEEQRAAATARLAKYAFSPAAQEAGAGLERADGSFRESSRPGPRKRPK